MSKHMDDVMLAAEGEPTAGKAAATILNGVAALVDKAASEVKVGKDGNIDEAPLRLAVREIRREAAALEEIVTRKRASEPDPVPEKAPAAAQG